MVFIVIKKQILTTIENNTDDRFVCCSTELSSVWNEAAWCVRLHTSWSSILSDASSEIVQHPSYFGCNLTAMVQDSSTNETNPSTEHSGECLPLMSELNKRIYLVSWTNWTSHTPSYIADHLICYEEREGDSSTQNIKDCWLYIGVFIYSKFSYYPLAKDDQLRH